MKRLAAILFVQFYLVSVFGFSLSQQICCDDVSAENIVCHETSRPQQVFLPECPLCETDHQVPEHDHCCPDCEKVGISIVESKNNGQQYNNPGVTTGQKNPVLLYTMLLPWMAPAIPPTGQLLHRVSDPVHAFRMASGDIPIFVRDCTYRI